MNDTRRPATKADGTALQPEPPKADWRLDPVRIVPVAYRPFDTRFTYYTGKSKGFHCRARGEVMRHFSQSGGVQNVGLITARSNKSQRIDHFFVSNAIVETKCGESTTQSATLPLWLLPEQSDLNQPPGAWAAGRSAQVKEESAQRSGDTEQSAMPLRLLASERHPNLAPDFLAALAQALSRPLTPPHGLPEGVTPEDVLAYVYAVLHAPSYRSRYAGFLKSDFPRIPLLNQALVHVDIAKNAIDFVSIWRALLPLGRQLIDLHLLKNLPTNLRVKFVVQGSNEVEKPRFEVCNGSGRVWINATQYFDGVPFETWSFKVGGYQVCEKWLKDRKGRTLDFADIQHYGQVVAALTRTRELMQEIDTVANGQLWPLATL